MNRIGKYLGFALTISLLFCFVADLEARRQALKGRAQAAYRSARIYLQQEMFDRALGQYKVVLEHDSRHVETLKSIADIYFFNADFEEGVVAKELYQNAFRFFERTISTIESIPNWERYTSAHDKSTFADFKLDAEQKMASIYARIFRIGQEMYAEDDFEGAEALFLELVGIDPTRGEAFQMLIAIATVLGDETKKVEYSLMFLEVASDNTQVIANLAIEFEKQGDWESARQYYELFVEKEPNMVAGYLSLAYALINLDDFTGALERYEMALALDPNDVDILDNAYRIASQLNDFERAIRFQKQIVALEETIENVRYLCSTLARMQLWEELITYSKLWHRLEPDNRDPVHFIIGAAGQLRNTALQREYSDILNKM